MIEPMSDLSGSWASIRSNSASMDGGGMAARRAGDMIRAGTACRLLWRAASGRGGARGAVRDDRRTVGAGGEATKLRSAAASGNAGANPAAGARSGHRYAI